MNAPTVNALLDRLDGVQKCGRGWRARCPACGGHGRKVSITEVDDRVLVKCFAGCATEDVLTAVGLTFADLFPPKAWPASPEERRTARKAAREANVAAAIEVLSLEAQVVKIGLRKFLDGDYLTPEDYERLFLACDRFNDAATELAR